MSNSNVRTLKRASASSVIIVRYYFPLLSSVIIVRYYRPLLSSVINVRYYRPLLLSVIIVRYYRPLLSSVIIVSYYRPLLLSVIIVHRVRTAILWTPEMFAYSLCSSISGCLRTNMAATYMSRMLPIFCFLRLCSDAEGFLFLRIFKSEGISDDHNNNVNNNNNNNNNNNKLQH